MSQRIVVDASVVFGWLFGETDLFDRAQEVLHALRRARMLVPAIWQVEVANVLVVKERQRRIDGAFAKRCLRRLEDLACEVDTGAATTAFDQVLPLAKGHQLTAYDATYLELALRAKVPLATFDAPLRAAAKRVGVELFESV